MKNILNYGDGPKAIYEVLKQQIIAGELKAGEELKIMPLAKEMDISIVPLREAIRMLAAESLVELRPRRSPIIARMNERELIEMNQIRGALEPIVLADAVPRHDEASIAVCQDLLERDERSTDLWEKVELNRQFHLAVLEPSRMKRSIAIIADQYDGIARITQFRVVDHGGMIGKHNFEHEAILDAVRLGNVEKAVVLMTRHIDHATVRAKHELSNAAEAGATPAKDPAAQATKG
jgi:DNA-binding GntR family transcriptional regulator